MAICKRPRFNLTIAVFLFLAAAFICTCISNEAYAAKSKVKRRPNTHELGRSHAKYSRDRRRTPASTRFKVSCNHIASLKKISIWNKRPYQFASPLINGNRLYVGVDAGFFYAFDVDREKELWKVKTDGPVQAKAVFSDGIVYIGDVEGHMHAFDEGTGEKKWTAVLDADILATPYVEGSRIYISTMSGRLYALDTGTGTELWHTEADEKRFGFSIRRSSSPVAYGGLVFYGASSGILRAVRGSDGQLVWSEQLSDVRGLPGDVDSAPLIYNGKLYASSVDGSFASIDPPSGRIAWTIDAGGVNDSVAQGGRIFASGNGSVYSVDPESGLIYWQQDLEVPEISSPAAGDHFLAVTSTQKKVYIIDSDSGDIAYERYVGKGSLGDPVFANGKIYLLSNTGKLFSFTVKEVPPKPQKKPREKKHV